MSGGVMERGSANGKEQGRSASKEAGKGSGKEHGKSGGKEAGKGSGSGSGNGNGKEHGKGVNGKAPGAPKVKEEERNLDRDKGKGANGKTPGAPKVKEEERNLDRDKGKSANGKTPGAPKVKEEERNLDRDKGKGANGKTPGAPKVKEEERTPDRDKGKGAIAKRPPSKTPVKTESSVKLSPVSATKAGASPTVVKKKVTLATTTVAATRTVTEVKKEKKVYDLPGQKHDPPEERDALRIFYSTLREQVPESEMAEFWLMEYGLLPHDEAKKAFKRKQNRTQPSKQGSAAKASTTASRLLNGSPAQTKPTPVSNGKGKQTTKVTESAVKAKNKRPSNNSESDGDDEFLNKIVTKKTKT